MIDSPCLKRKRIASRYITEKLQVSKDLFEESRLNIQSLHVNSSILSIGSKPRASF